MKKKITLRGTMYVRVTDPAIVARMEHVDYWRWTSVNGAFYARTFQGVLRRNPSRGLKPNG